MFQVDFSFHFNIKNKVWKVKIRLKHKCCILDLSSCYSILCGRSAIAVIVSNHVHVFLIASPICFSIVITVHLVSVYRSVRVGSTQKNNKQIRLNFVFVNKIQKSFWAYPPRLWNISYWPVGYTTCFWSMFLDDDN